MRRTTTHKFPAALQLLSHAACAPPPAVDVEPEMFNAADDALALLEGQEPASEKTDTDFFNSFDDDFDDEDVA